MSEIKSAEERIHPMALDDKSVWCNAYFDEVAELRAAYEALQKENAELKHINLTSLADLHFKNRDLEDRNAAQAKRIAELEAATEHLGLTPKQAADGLTRYKAQVTEIESLRKQVESVKYFLLTCSSPDCVFTANTLRDQANTLLDQISASKNGE